MQKTSRRRRYPRARTDLRFHSAAGGLALHDGSGPRAEHLDFAAALVLTYCDGQHDTGYAQPTRNELRKIRGVNSIYHNNGIQTWLVKSDGEVENVEVS